MPFWQFFSKGRDGRALLVQSSRIPRWISKIIFVLGSYEFLAMLEGKIRKGSVQVAKTRNMWKTLTLVPSKKTSDQRKLRVQSVYLLIFE